MRCNTLSLVSENLAPKRTIKRRTSPSTKAVAKQRTLARKQVAEGRKQIAATKRTLRKQTKDLQSQIERLLGEEYDSLAQAKRALKRESKPVKSKLPKKLKKAALKNIKSAVSSVTRAFTEKAVTLKHAPIEKPTKQTQPHIDVTPSQKFYSLRELRDGDRRKVTEYLDDRLNANALDKALLKPGESWAAQVSYTYTGLDGKTHTGYARTWNIFAGASALFRRLAGYVENAKISPTQKANWLNQVKILKFGGSGAQWTKEKEAERAKSNDRRKKVSKKLKAKTNKVKVKRVYKIPGKKG